MNKHHAPPVVYPLARSRSLMLVFGGLWLAGCILTWFWIHNSQTYGAPQLAGLAANLVVGLAGFRAFKNPAAGSLVWDGQNWFWESAGYQAGIAEYELTVVADFQHALLLRMKNKAHAQLWFWVERPAFESRWLDLRRAVYSPHRTPTDQVAT